MRIGIDFDGVICYRTSTDIPLPEDFREDGVMMKGVTRALRWLIEQGHDIYVFTNRIPRAHVHGWMLENGLPSLEVTNQKLPNTKMYIDDRAVRFTNWNDICRLIG